MDAQMVRAQADRALMDEILAEDQVRTVLDRLAQSDEPYGMRRSLLARALRLTRAISPELESLLGPGSVPRRLDPELLRAHMGERIAAVNKLVRPAKRAQLIRDLALIARADGHVDAAEVAVLHGFARALAVRPSVVEAAIAAPTELD